MIELLIASIISCSESQRLIDNVVKSQVLSREEVIEVIKQNTEPGCYERSELN